MRLLDELKHRNKADKTRHREGDLYYGYYDQIEESRRIIEGPYNLHSRYANTLDELCTRSGLNSLLRNYEGNEDYVRGYYNMIDAIRNFDPPQETHMRQSDKWMLFLKSKIEYLLIDDTLEQLRQGDLSDIDAYKNKLTKNGENDFSTEKWEEFRNAILKAFECGNCTQHDDSFQYSNDISEWVSDLIFRKLSKLGIDFTIQEGNVVHFNIDSPSLDGENHTRVDQDMESLDAYRIPITFSELRHINRHYTNGNTAPGNHPQIDFHSTASRSISRSPSMGDLSEYRENRTQAKKAKPRRG